MNSVADVPLNLYLLSWMYPSTLCSSFPNIPQALKFNTHLSPVLQEERGEIFSTCSLQKHIIVFIVYLPVVEYFHCAILLYPQFAQNDVVYTAEGVTPRVCLVVPEGAGDRARGMKNGEEDRNIK